MYRKLKVWVLTCWLVLLCTTTLPSLAQSWGMKTNFLLWATTTPNVGLEFKMGEKWSLDLSGNYNPFTFKENSKLKHWAAFPEVRWWTCEAFNGHFLGLHLVGGEFNIGGINVPLEYFKSLKEYRYQGWVVGGGLTYGYQWPIAKRWNLEFSLSAGYAHFFYEKFKCPKCGEKVGEKHQDYFGPTKATLSLIYLIK